MKHMIVERYKNGDAKGVYKRFFEKGRMAPDGLTYVDSWVDEKMQVCFQIMECRDIELLNEWVNNWRDLVDFEIYPVISSAEAQKIMRMP